MTERTPMVWVIAYVNSKFIDVLENELKNSSLDIKVYVPVVKILKKEFKKEKIFEHIPLMFNYGFVYMPYEYVTNQEKLSRIRKEISCIYGWLKDVSVTHKHHKATYTSSGDEDTSAEGEEDNRKKVVKYVIPPPVENIALVKTKDVITMVETARAKSIFNDNIQDTIQEGEFIKLKGYPYDNMMGMVKIIDEEKEEITIELELPYSKMDVKVSFFNVFYTIYNDYNPNSLSDLSLDDLTKDKSFMVDRVFAKLDTNG